MNTIAETIKRRKAVRILIVIALSVLMAVLVGSGLPSGTNSAAKTYFNQPASLYPQNLGITTQHDNASSATNPNANTSALARALHDISLAATRNNDSTPANQLLANSNNTTGDTTNSQAPAVSDNNGDVATANQK